MKIETQVAEAVATIRTATTNIACAAQYSDMGTELKEQIQKEVRDIIAALNGE
jgi:hypothetical protein